MRTSIQLLEQAMIKGKIMSAPYSRSVAGTVSRYRAWGSPQGWLGTSDGLPQGWEQGALLCLRAQARPAIPTSGPWVEGTRMLLRYRPHKTHTRCGKELPSHLPMRPGQKPLPTRDCTQNRPQCKFLPRASGAPSCDTGHPVNHCSSSGCPGATGSLGVETRWDVGSLPGTWSPLPPRGGHSASLLYS